MRHYTREVQRYFTHKADRYDAVDDQLYWRLSDALLWQLISPSISRLSHGRLLDAGGGTGRWSLRIAQQVPLDSVVVLDLTMEMLRVAQQKSDQFPTAVRFVQADLESDLPFSANESGKFSGAVVLHNVIGFVRDPQAVLERLAGCLEEGGLLWLMAPALLHMAYFYLNGGRSRELDDLFNRRRGRFTMEMPELGVFTPSGLRELCESAGYRVESICGFPSLIYPGEGDTHICGNDEVTAGVLATKSAFEAALRAELRALEIGSEAIAARGANLLVIASKQAG